ncbi:hypothetical protein U1Q18_022938, partial [Sarracenia purpurea var. burkii]
LLGDTRRDSTIFRYFFNESRWWLAWDDNEFGDWRQRTEARRKIEGISEMRRLAISPDLGFVVWKNIGSYEMRRLVISPDLGFVVWKNEGIYEMRRLVISPDLGFVVWKNEGISMLRRLAIGDWRLAIGYWLLATGYWLLAKVIVWKNEGIAKIARLLVVEPFNHIKLLNDLVVKELFVPYQFCHANANANTLSPMVDGIAIGCSGGWDCYWWWIVATESQAMAVRVDFRCYLLVGE